MENIISHPLLPVILAVSIIILTIITASITNRIFRKFIGKATSYINGDPTSYNFLRRVLVGVIYLLGFSFAIYMIPALRAISQSLLAGAGILAVAVGFASQQAFSNIVAGIFIIIFRPFSVNDRVIIKDTLSGIVEDITLRHTVIRNYENRRIIIPNSMISDEIVINADLVDKEVCKWIEVGISYSSDVQLAKNIMQEEISVHPLFLDRRSEEEKAANEPVVKVRVISLGEYAVNLRAWAWAPDNAAAFALGCDMYEKLKQRFDEEGKEIPFPYRSIVMK